MMCFKGIVLLIIFLGECGIFLLEVGLGNIIVYNLIYGYWEFKEVYFSVGL